MIDDPESRLLRDILFEILEQVVVEFLHFAALRADEVVVMMARRIDGVDLIAAAAVAELHLLQDAELRKQLEAAVDCRESDVHLPLAEDVMHILR